MSSFTENLISADHRPTLNSLQESSSKFLELYGHTPNFDHIANSSFPNELTTAAHNMLMSTYQPTVGSHNLYYNATNQSNETLGTSSMNLCDERFQYDETSFENVTKSSVNSNWRISQTKTVPSFISPNNFHFDAPETQIDPTSGLVISKPISEHVNNNGKFQIPQSTFGGSAWCSDSWSPHLDVNTDQTGWKNLPTVNLSDHHFMNSDNERSWRFRTTSDNSKFLSSSKRNLDATRTNHHVQRRRGRTLSGGSSASASDFDAIHLPSGHVLNIDDFNVSDDPNSIANQVNRSVGQHFSDSLTINNNTLQGSNAVSLASKFQNINYRPRSNETEAFQLHNMNCEKQQNCGQPLSVSENSMFLFTNKWSNSSPSNTDGFAVKSNEGQFQPSEETLLASNSIFNNKSFKRQTANQFTQHNQLLDAFGQKPLLDVMQNDFSPEPTIDHPVHEAHSNINEENQWFYKDPQGRLQGEFSSAQMYGWLLIGRYFTHSLQIRRKCDDTFSTLADYMKLFGRIPFMSGPRIPPFQGGITPMMILMVRTSLAIQQSAVTEAFVSNNVSEDFQSTPLPPIENLNIQSLPDNIISENVSNYENWIPNAPGKPINTDTNTNSTSDSSFFQTVDQPSNLNKKNNSQTKSITSRHKNASKYSENELNSWSNLNCSVPGETKTTNISNKFPKRNEECLDGICNKDDAFLNKLTSSTDPRSVSQSGSSSSHSSVWARSTDSPQDNGRRLFVNDEDQMQTTELINKSVKATVPKNCWTEKLGKNIKQSLNYGLTKSSETAVISPLKTSKQETGCTDGAISQKHSNSRQPLSSEKNLPLSKKGNNSKKNSKSSVSQTNENSDELNSLISWVQSALTGIELREKLDIPTFVELLTTIDAPYEVESMLFAYLVKSNQSVLFVKEFLDRRHCCWQLHRKHIEKLTELRKASNNKKTPSLVPTTVATDISVANDKGNTKSLLENTEILAESPWQQMKPKNNSNRKSKKSKQRS